MSIRLLNVFGTDCNILGDNKRKVYFNDNVVGLSKHNKTKKYYVYGSVHHNIVYEITNKCSYMQSILFHC